MEQKNLYTVTVFTENQAGVMSQIAGVFTRRDINLEGISVSPVSISDIRKITMVCTCEEALMKKIIKQIEKRIDVLKAFYYTDDEIVYQEIALYKVPTEALLDENKVEEIIRRHNARILEVTRTYTIIEKTGHSDETEALFCELQDYGITQFVRSGRVAVTKSTAERLSNFLDQQEKREMEIEHKTLHS